MVYLTVDQVRQAHKRAIERYGGDPNLLDYGKLESAVESVNATFGGELLLPTIEEVASGYWYSICQAHAFQDGNKRVALYAVDLFLQFNGFILDLSWEEASDITLGVASGQIETRRELLALIRIRRVNPTDYDEL